VQKVHEYSLQEDKDKTIRIAHSLQIKQLENTIYQITDGSLGGEANIYPYYPHKRDKGDWKEGSRDEEASYMAKDPDFKSTDGKLLIQYQPPVNQDGEFDEDGEANYRIWFEGMLFEESMDSWRPSDV
jgi:hypothetical protein